MERSFLAWVRTELMKPKYKTKKDIPASHLTEPDDAEFALIMAEIERMREGNGETAGGGEGGGGEGNGTGGEELGTVG